MKNREIFNYGIGKIMAVFCHLGFRGWVLILSLIIIVLGSCSKDGEEVRDAKEGKAEVIDTVDVDLTVDQGEVGLVIDNRDIFRKGYKATEAKVSFPEFPSLDSNIEIDPVSNLSVIRFSNEDLSTDEKEAFKKGTAVSITVKDEDNKDLVDYTNDSQILDSSNDPISLTTAESFKIPPLNINTQIPYLLQPEGQDGVIRTTCSSCFPVSEFTVNDTKQQFIFVPIDGEINTFKIKGYQYPDPDHNGTGAYFSMGQPNLPQYSNSKWIFLMDEGNADEFVLEQDKEGWVKIKKKGTNFYLSADLDDLRFYEDGTGKPFRFKLISDNISWKVENRSTVYNETIMPPTQVEFAYQATIRNCTSGLLTETVGVTKSKTSTHTTSAIESIKLFNSNSVEAGFKVSAALGGEIYGATVKVDVSAKYKFTHTKTTTTGSEEIDEIAEETEVSRTRSLEVPPGSAVEVYDAVRVVKDARIPFTEVYRIMATATSSDGTEYILTGDEIRTQMLFNLVTAVIKETGPDYVDVTMRGQVDISEMYSTESGADQIPSNCK